ncbi:MAG: inositol monophosphatase family protein [Fimbriimonadaceae bacterium]|nr:inositol monophosphatase family protein [Fimbriimonadaceae bacterium]
MSPRLAFALNAAHAAGRFTLSMFQTGTAVESKGDETPVTAADRGAERMIRERLAESFPHDAILGEEEGGDAQVADRWVIDPIDGTKAFIAGVPSYSTLLSYEVDRQPVLGVVYFPGLDLMFHAERGGGAFVNGRPIRVSEKGLDGSILCCGSLRTMDRLGRLAPYLGFKDRAMDIRTWGDAYGYALVAWGKAEAMIDPRVALWDISSVKVLVEEAGGRFTTPDGADALRPIDATGGYAALATNGRVHEELVAAFRSV